MKIHLYKKLYVPNLIELIFWLHILNNKIIIVINVDILKQRRRIKNFIRSYFQFSIC